MKFLVWLPFIATVVVPLTAPRVARWMAPRTAALTLTGVAAATAFSFLASVAIVAATAIGRIPWLARDGEWSPAAIASHAPPPLVAGCLCAVVAPIVLGLAGHGLAHRIRSLWTVECELRRGHDRMLVVPDPAPLAYAVGGLRGGRITVSTGMLEALAPDERHALLAHEAAHLRLGHHWLRLVTGLAAASNPALRRLPNLVEQACEEWADDDAAKRTGSRDLVARAVARAALATHRFGTSGAGSASAAAVFATGASVPVRVQALLDPPRRGPLGPAALIASALLVAALVGATLDAGQDCAQMFQFAHRTLEHGLALHHQHR